MDVPDGGELWRLALEHSPVGKTLVGLDGRLLVVNRALCDMLGYDEDELRAKGFQEITHADDLRADLDLFEQALAGEIDSYRMLKRYLHADGRIVWGDLSVALVRGTDGSPLHFISQILDVTEQERDRRTLEAIFETVNVGLLLVDREGHYERMNRRHQETMSIPFPHGHDGEAGQLGYVYLLDGTTPMSREEMPSYRAVQGEEFDNLRYWVGPEPQTRAAYSVSARSIRDASGELSGAVLAYQDITDLMRAMQVKDDFVASVSHELRTPLTAVLGYLEVLRERGDLPADVTGQLEVIERNAARLEGLVSDLLCVAQARQGALDLQRTEVDLAALVAEAVEAVRHSAEGAGIRLVADLPDSLTATVDGQRIRQVVDNLVGNAVKYTEEGGSVHVSLRPVGASAELSVRDTGIGIAETEAEQVFSQFFRGSNALRRHTPGTGLGLHIARSIVEAHGGEVYLQSTVGQGSTFRVTVPTAGASIGA